MKPRLRTNAVLAILLMGFFALVGKALWDIRREVATRRLEAELQSVILPRFELHKATLAEALVYLRTEAEKAGLRRGTRFTVLSKSESQKFFRKRIRIAEGTNPTHDPSPAPLPLNSPAKITVNLTNIPVSEVCKYVAGLADLNMRQRITHDSVLFFDVSGDGTVAPILRGRFQIYPGLFSNAPKLPNGKLDARFSLETHGVEFYEGASAEFDPAIGVLRIVNTQEQLDLVQILDSEGGRIPTTFERVSNWIEARLAVFSPAPNPSFPPPGLPLDPPQDPANDDPASPSPAIPGL